MPLLFSFHPKLRFYERLKFFLPANLLVAFVFVAWDTLFTKLGVWGFNPKYLLGIYLFNLPIEEVLFFFCIPYASLFTYHCLKLFFERPNLPSKLISVSLSILLIMLGLLTIPRLYTSVTFISLGLVIGLNEFWFRQTWLPHFYLSYLLILLPFFLVNGLLTGSWIDEPVVWYNNSENLQLRLMTIPLEDVFYGMLLLLLNTSLYERFRNLPSKLKNETDGGRYAQ